MLAYKTKSRIDKKGNLSIHNLPIKNKESVEIIILIDDQKPEELNITQKISQLKASFGTINYDVPLTDEMLMRDNLYGQDGR